MQLKFAVVSVNLATPPPLAYFLPLALALTLSPSLSVRSCLALILLIVGQVFPLATTLSKMPANNVCSCGHATCNLQQATCPMPLVYCNSQALKCDVCHGADVVDDSLRQCKYMCECDHLRNRHATGAWPSVACGRGKQLSMAGHWHCLACYQIALYIDLRIECRVWQRLLLHTWVFKQLPHAACRIPLATCHLPQAATFLYGNAFYSHLAQAAFVSCAPTSRKRRTSKVTSSSVSLPRLLPAACCLLLPLPCLLCFNVFICAVVLAAVPQIFMTLPHI